MKDFYDVYSLANSYPFEGSCFCSAIRSTFEGRSTAIPGAAPIALSPEFSRDRLKMSQWSAFVSSGNVRQTSLTLGEVIDLLSLFLLPPMTAACHRQQFDRKWIPPGPWDQG